MICGYFWSMKQTTGNAFQGSFDPSIFDHPLAQSVEWFGLNRFAIPHIGVAMKTEEDGSIVFGPRIMSYVLAGFMLILPVLFGLFFLRSISSLPTMKVLPVYGVLIIPVLGFLFQLAGAYLLLSKSSFYFNKDLYRAGFRLIVGRRLGTKMPEVQLNNVAALQLIARRTPSRGDKPISYELNLVLKDGSRAHVVNYRRLQCLQEDAMQVAEKLSVPLWDASAYITGEKRGRSRF